MDVTGYTELLQENFLQCILYTIYAMVLLLVMMMMIRWHYNGKSMPYQATYQCCSLQPTYWGQYLIKIHISMVSTSASRKTNIFLYFKAKHTCCSCARILARISDNLSDAVAVAESNVLISSRVLTIFFICCSMIHWTHLGRVKSLN